MPEGSAARIRTDAAARAAKPDPTRAQVEYRVDGVRGLALRVTRDGTKTWTLRYRTLEGEQRRQTLGPYPTLSLADARTAAEIALGAVAGGADPAKARRVAKVAAKSRRLATIEDLIEGYFAAAEKGKHRRSSRPKRASTLADERSYFTRFISPKLGSRPIDDLTRAEVQRLVDEIEVKSPAGARITRNVIRQAFNYAMMQERTDRNPAARILVQRWKDRERVLTDDELRNLWKALLAPQDVKGLELAQGTALALRLAAVTLQRGGEVCGIHAREIDRQGKLWTIPGTRTKNHRTHAVPLSDLALDLLADAFALSTGKRSAPWSGYAFPSPRTEKAPLTRHGLSRAMQRVTAAVGIENVTPHDLRRTGATNITSERLGFPRFVVSRVLNQISDGGGAAAATAIYDLHSYLPEKRKALDAWAALLAQIVDGKQREPNVVNLKRVEG